MIIERRVPEIADSWDRCIKQYKLDFCQCLKPPRLTDAEIRNAKEQFDD